MYKYLYYIIIGIIIFIIFNNIDRFSIGIPIGNDYSVDFSKTLPTKKKLESLGYVFHNPIVDQGNFKLYDVICINLYFLYLSNIKFESVVTVVTLRS